MGMNETTKPKNRGTRELLGGAAGGSDAAEGACGICGTGGGDSGGVAP